MWGGRSRPILSSDRLLGNLEDRANPTTPPLDMAGETPPGARPNAMSPGDDSESRLPRPQIRREYGFSRRPGGSRAAWVERIVPQKTDRPRRMNGHDGGLELGLAGPVPILAMLPPEIHGLVSPSSISPAKPLSPPPLRTARLPRGDAKPKLIS